MSTKIIGTIDNFPFDKKVKVYLQKYVLEDVILVDSAVVSAKGRFTMSPAVSSYGFFVLNLTGGRVCPLIIGETDSTITIQADYTELLNGQASVIGSAENMAHTILLNLYSEVRRTEDSIRNEVSKISFVDSSYYEKKHQNRVFFNRVKQIFNNRIDSIGTHYPKTYVATSLISILKHPTRIDRREWLNEFDGDRAFYHWHFFDHLDFNDSGIQYHPAFRNELDYYLRDYSGEFTKDFNESVDVILSKADEGTAMFQYLTEKLIYHFVLEGADETVAYIEDRYFNGCADEMINNIRKTAEFKRGLPVLSVFPEFELPNAIGKKFRLSEVYKSNEVTLVMFWKSTCPHCLDEMETIKSLKNTYGKRGLEVVAISLDTEEKEWKNAINEFKMNWINLSDLKGYESEVTQECLVYATPTIFLLNSDGIILRKGLRGTELKNTIRQLFVN